MLYNIEKLMRARIINEALPRARSTKTGVVINDRIEIR
jgi:hypothetical protein